MEWSSAPVRYRSIRRPAILFRRTFRGQTEQVLKNLSAVLVAAGSGLDKVVKTTVFLADMNDFAEMNEVYGKFFSENKPATGNRPGGTAAA